jgi:glycosyltransferase involved in cell wall biosynthesis
VIAVNTPLADWARCKLKVPTDRVWYLPNFVVEPAGASEEKVDLPGVPGKRIVCVANLRPEKDHPTLIEAMRNVVQAEPEATLLLVGSESNREQVEKVKARIRQHDLDKHVFLLGSKNNVWPILRSCDVGVLPSVSEGLPLALLEYGMAGLPAVATRVGQVPEVLDDGRAGILVLPGCSRELAAALLRLMESVELRGILGEKLRRHVQEKYSEAAVMEKVLRIYGEVMKPKATQARWTA